MAEAIVGILLNNVESLIKREFSLMWNAKSELEKLSSYLIAIQAVLADAETQQITKKTVKDWLAKLKDVAFDADDTLNEWATDESLFQQPSDNDHVHASCFSSLKNKGKLTKSHYKIAKKIQKIRERFEEIAKEKSHLHLGEGGAAVARPSRNRETSSVPNEAKIYGRDADIENIVKLLLESLNNADGDVPVFPITGMCGVGKTTLAQFVCKDERVIQHFETRIWSCASRDFDVKRLSRSVLEDITRTPCILDNLNAIQRELQEQLKDKLFLLVVDDVWTEKQELWRLFKNSLRSGAKGSTIIITTRLQVVADIAGTAPAYQLSLLPNDDCLSLFQSYAFGNMGTPENPKLLEIGQQIVEKCGGLPLAARDLGSLLCKQDERQWELIRDRKSLSLQEDLRLSYNSLSSPTRQCFAYCALFPKGYVMEKENLIHIWMANGLVPIDEGTGLEVAGDGIFNELLSHSMLQGMRDDDGNIVKCAMHDLLHDFASSILKNHYLRMEADGETNLNIPEKARHLSVIGSSSQLPSNQLRKSLSLRTLMFIYHDKHLMFRDFTHLTHLRTLHLNSVELNTLHPSIGNLKHLRYLNLQSCSLEFEIPETIRELRNLQMLNLAHNNLVALPPSIGDLQNLRYLNLSHSQKIKSLPESIRGLKSLQTLEAAHCGELEALPSSIGDLKNMRYLNLSRCQKIKSLPESVRGLKSLQTLEAAHCGELEALPSEIGDLKNMRYLNLSECQKIKSLPESIGGLESLQTLEAAHCGELEALPSSIGDLKNMRYLNLSQCQKIKSLPESIGGLESLQTLKAVYSGGGEELPSRTLEVTLCGGLEALPDSISNLQSLKHLDMEGCYGLKGMPNGLGSLTGLQTLSYFKVGDEERGFGGIKELQGLNLLREGLTIRGLHHVKSLEDAEGASLMRKPNLSRLELYWYDDDDDDDDDVNSRCKEVLEGLQPHPNTKELEISRYPGAEFPTWMEMGDPLSSFPKLVDLLLCRLHNLEKWSLNWKENESLPALQSLQLSSCSRLKSLPEQICNLTSLKSLHITSCLHLASLPHQLSRLTSLESLEILCCSRLRSLPKMGIEGRKSCLRSLHIADCEKLTSRLEGLQHLTALESLTLINCPELKFSTQDLVHLTALKIRRFGESFEETFVKNIMGV